MTHEPLKIVIVGGGSSGWMTAAGVSLACQNRIADITLIESDEIGIVGVGEATIPSILHFNQLLQINEFEFMSRTQGSFKLGIDFVNWGWEGNRYMHPFGVFGKPLGMTNFHHYWLKAYAAGQAGPLSDYNLNIALSYQNLFSPPSPDKASPLSEMVHAYHFDAALYAKYLRSLAEQRGVKRVEGKVVDVDLHSENGFIKSLRLSDGRVIEGDFFVDCSGFRAILIEGALKTGFVDWSDILPCNRAIAISHENSYPLTPYTRSTAHKVGWQWRIPLRHRTGGGYVYASDWVSDDEAVDILLKNIDGKHLGDPRPIRFHTGRRKQAWNKNCVAIGLSSGFLEPLESTSIHLVLQGVSKLMRCLPDKHMSPHLVAQFNRETQHEYEDVRDFLALHYKANRRPEPFWQYCREQEVSDTLNTRMSLFRESGRLFIHHTELFRIDSWLSVLLGQGIMPESYDPVADVMATDDIAHSLNFIRTAFAQTAQTLPTHEAFLTHHFGPLGGG